MHDIGLPIKNRVEIMRKEMPDNNLFFNAVYNIICNTNLPTIKDSALWALNIGHPQGTLISDTLVPLHLRRGYCKWEFSPYQSYSVKKGEDEMSTYEITGNADFLLAYYISL